MSHVLSWRHGWRIIITTTALGLALALGFSLLLPMQYSSSMRLLITQMNTTGLDPYTAMKATERIASSMSELVYTSTFYQNVMTGAQGFNVNYFPLDEHGKRKLWQKTVETSVAPGTGIMTVTAYHPSRDQARILVEAASRELASQATNYFGADIHVQVIDAPLDSQWLARPNFISNAAFGLFVGLLIGIGWVLMSFSRRELF